MRTGASATAMTTVFLAAGMPPGQRQGMEKPLSAACPRPTMGANESRHARLSMNRRADGGSAAPPGILAGREQDRC